MNDSVCCNAEFVLEQWTAAYGRLDRLGLLFFRYCSASQRPSAWARAGCGRMLPITRDGNQLCWRFFMILTKYAGRRSVEDCIFPDPEVLLSEKSFISYDYS